MPREHALKGAAIPGERMVICLPAVILAGVLLFGGGIVTAFVLALVGAGAMAALMTVVAGHRARREDRRLKVTAP